jgi:hypothetical protein
VRTYDRKTIDIEIYIGFYRAKGEVARFVGVVAVDRIPSILLFKLNEQFREAEEMDISACR